MVVSRILVPVDFSDASRTVLEYAIDMAESFGARVELLHVWDLPGYVRPDLTVWVGDVSGTYAEQAQQSANEHMSRLVDDAGLKDHASVDTRVLCGTPHATILELLDGETYDLVVMGTRGRTGLAHALLGSVAERVVRHAPCPVLTVRR
jgi:nucleotide-binding universal stress UspA family protein